MEIHVLWNSYARPSYDFGAATLVMLYLKLSAVS